MKKNLILLFIAMISSFASFAALSAISGPVTTCAGNTVFLTDSGAGGTWSSSNPAIVSIDATGGATAISAGSATITYAIGSSFVTAPFTVIGLPDPISETSTSFCVGGTATCTDASSGGTWSSSGGVSVNSAGLVTGISGGIGYVYYSISGCAASITNTVTATYTGVLSGSHIICLSSTDAITDSGASGGSWSSSSPAIASVSGSGVVTGIALGMATISYTATGACGLGTDTFMVTVSNTTNPGYVYGGGGSVDVSGTATIYDEGASATGTWSSSNPAVASINPTTGLLAGISTGTVTITYSVDGCGGIGTATTTVTVVPFGSTLISGPSGGCTGSDYYFSDSAYSGGSWSTSNASVATISATGHLTALSAGTTIISYDVSGSYITTLFTVYETPAAITETSTSYCPGATATCSDATAGGTWSSGETYVATINTSGVVTGINAGGTYIYYIIGGVCSASIWNTVTSTSPGYLTVPGPICIGSSVTIIDSSMITGGTWSSSDPSIATINSSGVATGISAGTVTISYSLSGACGSGYSTTTLTVSGTTDPGTVSGSSSIYIGATASFSDYSASATGTWSSSDASIASVDPSTGVVTGMSTGTATISYNVDGCGGVAVATNTVTVIAVNGISGNVLFGGPGFYGSVKVYLITYNAATSDLEAIDSTVVFPSGTSAYYQFTGLATDSFRVKASTSSDSLYDTTGYVPTYHTSSCYWSAANVIYHTSGGSDIDQNINMAYGTTSAGPGFIGGNVTMGANKGTSTYIPDAGLLIFAVNSTTGALTQQTYTDASGNYTFSNLPIGTYLIYPEAINYATTAYTSINITASSTSMTAANFVQHTISRTITPIISGVSNTVPVEASVFTFPNPVGSKLNIQWNENSSEKGTISITDVTGREVSKSAIELTKGSGTSQLDLSALTSGIYMITIKSDNISYTNKIQVQH